MNSMSKWFNRESAPQPQIQQAEMPKPAIIERNARVSSNVDVMPRLTISFDRIKDAIVFIENNTLLGAGKITKIEHLTDHLFTNFKLASDNPDSPVLTYEEILEEIKLVNDNELFGAGKFSKREILTDRLLAKFTLRQKAQRDANAKTAAASTPVVTSSPTEETPVSRQQRVRAAVQSSSSAPVTDGGLAFQ